MKFFPPLSWAYKDLNDYPDGVYGRDEAIAHRLNTADIRRKITHDQVRLNIFTLNQMPESLFDLNGLSGTKFKLPPNSTTNERIDIGLSEGIPLFNPRTYKNYRLKRFWTKRGLEKQTQHLCSLLQHDMENINAIVEKWHTVHKCNLTDWEGNIIEQKEGLR